MAGREENMDAQANCDHSQLQPYVVRSGTALCGKVGPPAGVVDIGISQNAYLCRVALPGIQKGPSKLHCQIQASGRIDIHGEIPEGEVLKSSPDIFTMVTQQLSPPGPFSVHFNLPGPVDTRFTFASSRQDGIVEIMVLKLK